mgnify:CR=1 FL=1
MGETGEREREAVGGPATIDRRRVLKTAVAAGVGMAAWSAPNITTLGATPAYAQNCSELSTVTEYVTTTSNTAGGCGANVRLQNSVTFGPANSFTATPNGSGCADGVETISFTGPATARCRIKTLDLYDNQGNLIDSYPQPAGSDGITIPLVPRAGHAGRKWGLTVECVPVGGCFPPSTTTTTLAGGVDQTPSRGPKGR